MRARGLWATLFATSAAGAACTGGDGGDDPPAGHLRGGSLVMTRTAVTGFDPAESLSGVGAFFAPPGPATAPWPEDGDCEWSSPAPTETPAPTPSPTATPPAIDWMDAGGSLTLRSNENALVLDRFEGPAGEIFYLTRADALPETFPTDLVYDLEIAGSDSPNGVAATTLAGALAAPAPLGIYAPDFPNAGMDAVPLAPGAAVQLGWVPGDLEVPVMMRMTVSGSSGSATLTCVTDDDGFYEIDVSAMAQFPSGGGTLTLSRHALHETKLAADTWLDAETLLTEGGAVLLP